MRVLVLFLWAMSVHAGFEKGNGGDAVICEKAHRGQTAFAYDYLEAEELAGIQIDFGDAESVDERVLFTLNKLKDIHPKRYKMYMGWFETFWDETLQLRGKDLIDVPDTDLGALPRGCKIVQTIVQIEPSLPWHRRYTIDMDAWDILTNRAKAGLILHELILREAREFKHQTTSKVRYFNSFLASKEAEGMAIEEYTKLVELSDMEKIEFDEIEYYISRKRDFTDENIIIKTEFKDGQIISGVVYDDTRLSFAHFDLSIALSELNVDGDFRAYKLHSYRGVYDYKVDSDFYHGIFSYGNGYESQIALNQKTGDLRIRFDRHSDDAKISGLNFEFDMCDFNKKHNGELLFSADGKLKDAKHIFKGKVLFRGEWINVDGKSVEFNFNQTVVRIY